MNGARQFGERPLLRALLKVSNENGIRGVQQMTGFCYRRLMRICAGCYTTTPVEELNHIAVCLWQAGIYRSWSAAKRDIFNAWHYEGPPLASRHAPTRAGPKTRRPGKRADPGG